MRKNGKLYRRKEGRKKEWHMANEWNILLLMSVLKKNMILIYLVIERVWKHLDC
jgi:hypothetical protein